jgi:hypothetical protein
VGLKPEMYKILKQIRKDIKQRGKIQGNVHENIFWIVYNEHCDKKYYNKNQINALLF